MKPHVSHPKNLREVFLLPLVPLFINGEWSFTKKDNFIGSNSL